MASVSRLLGLGMCRKLLVCDAIAFVGGFNIAPEYEGDGINCGWCDLGLRLEGPLVTELSRSFDEMFSRAGFPERKQAHERRRCGERTLAACW